MTARKLSTEATQNMFRMMQNKTPLPAKIVEHKERMEASIDASERRHEGKNGIDKTEYQALLSMKRSLDVLFGDWAEGVLRLRWIDIPELTDVTPDEIVRECVTSTESYFGNTGVEVLAMYLDACGQDDLLRRLAKVCTLRAREYLVGVVPLSTQSLFVLENPAEYFGTSDHTVLSRKMADYFVLFVNRQSPEHIKRALITQIESGIGNPVTAIVEAGFVYCEATVEHFGLKFEVGHPDVNKAFLEFEHWKAARLLEFLR